MQFKDVTSTTFGLVVAFLLPGAMALLSMTYWIAPVADAFETFLTADANLGLLLLMLLGALTLGLVVSAVRWLLYEVLLAQGGWVYGAKLTADERKRLQEQNRLAAYRAAVDETYRYHQFFGGLSLTAPALLIGWFNDLESGRTAEVLLVISFVALELLLVAAAIAAYKSYLQYTQAILAEAATA